jgi:hypothetical protein
MALFPFRRRAPARSAPDLRSQLISLVVRKDLASLAALVRDRRATITAAFKDWTTVPAGMQDDPPLLEQYGEMLLAVARIIEHDGDPSLARMLDGDPSDAPVEVWNEQIAIAAALSEQRRFSDAAQVLSVLADRLALLRGSAVDFYRPRVLGKLGVALYQSGETSRAREVTREARDICQQLGDEEGVQAYEGNLANMR